ncbi:LIM domain containing protein [Aphelenchoides avenae]|nr:LIM domain containing protein [Aphelenchus avenae]
MERPDGACQRCKRPIAQEHWTAVGNDVYHNDCLECGVCKKRLANGKFDVHENMIFCRECFVKSGNTKAKLAKQAANGATRKCTGCESTNVGTRVLRGGRVYCRRCYKCYHCRESIGEEDCLLLLNRLYCYPCQNAYERDRYALAHYGSGPQMLHLM